MNPPLSNLPPCDPFEAREQAKYGHPVASREHILNCLEQFQEPMKRSQLEKLLRIEEPRDRQALGRRIHAMMRDGQLVLDRANRLQRVEALSLVHGEVFHHREGFGRLKVKGYARELWVSPEQMRFILSGDWVLARVVPGRGQRQEARIVKVVHERNPEFVGRVTWDEKEGFGVEPHLNGWPRKFLWNGDGPLESHEIGMLVKSRILTRPSPAGPGLCSIESKLGGPEPSLKVAEEMACLTHGLPHLWLTEVLQEAEQLQPSEGLEAGREDLRHLPFVTIDGRDAQDFDDAVYGEPRSDGQGWKLWVAIADVAHYVPSEGLIDLEAQKRGTSVYFPQRVIPMLPERLSNDLCSLKPGQSRRVMVCEMDVSPTGIKERATFYEGVIVSCQRLTYDEVEHAFQNPHSPLLQKHPMLNHLRAAHEQLSQERKNRGALDLEREGAELKWDLNGQLQSVEAVKRGLAHQLIEELMILANVAAAEWMLSKKVAAIFRVHDKPDAAKIKLLKRILEPLSQQARKIGLKSSAAAYDAVVQDLKQGAAWPIAQTLILRSLKAATYEAQCRPHFGLALKAYTHFTSPIRRYPDLVVHRILKYLIRKLREAGPNTKLRAPHRRHELESIAAHATEHERRADWASREVLETAKCQYARKLLPLGEWVEGTLSGFNARGVFVRLPNLDMDGLVPMDKLPQEAYKLQPLEGSLEGAHYRFHLGKPLEVRMTDVSTWKREILLEARGFDSFRKLKPSTARPKKSRHLAP